MADLIDRYALLKKLRRYYNTAPGAILSADAIAAMSAIDQADAVGVELARHGRWIMGNPDEGEADMYCSACNTEYNFDFDGGDLEYMLKYEYRYCAYCGAKMDLEEEAP